MPRKLDWGLEALLDLDGERIVFEDGSWVQFTVRRVSGTRERPHGIEYSLTCHDRQNRRILGKGLQLVRAGWHSDLFEG